MNIEKFYVEANGIRFYCEKAGEGELIVLVPDGSNDCEPFETFMEELSSRYTVLSFDMRGGTRSMDENPTKVTPTILGDDVAEIVKAVNLGKATLYGCSSGGQAVLAAGKRHPELFRNILVHEAALQYDTPLPNAGFSYFQNIYTFEPYLTDGYTVNDIWTTVSAADAKKLSEEARRRIEENGIFWSKWYLGTVDMDSYSAEDFQKMPPTAFTVGTWSPSWLTFANIQTAKRGGCPVRWMQCSHHPEITCPKEYAQYIDEMVQKYL